MSQSAARARLMLAAWVTLVMLWPIQAAALSLGHRMTPACRMMPGMASMASMSVGSQTPMHGMNACRQLQCRHTLGLRTLGAGTALPVTSTLRFFALTLLVLHRFRPYASIPRGPPLYLRFAHLLI